MVDYGGIIHGTDDADFFIELVFDDLQCLGQIAIVGYDDSAIIVIEPGVIQQMHGKVDDFVKSRKRPRIVIPVKTGSQRFQRVTKTLDTGFHRCDDFLRECQG